MENNSANYLVSFNYALYLKSFYSIFIFRKILCIQWSIK